MVRRRAELAEHPGRQRPSLRRGAACRARRRSAGTRSSSARRAFREFLRYHTVRRRDGRPWRLVIAGDLFDFMSVVVPEHPDRPRADRATSARFGLGRGVAAGVERHAADLRGPPAAARRPRRGSRRRATGSTSSSATTTSSCSRPRSPTSCSRQLARGRRRRARARADPRSCRGSSTCRASRGSSTATSTTRAARSSSTSRRWIRRTAGSSTTPTTPRSATSASAVPELDPHGIEEWSFWGYMQLRDGAAARPHGQAVARATRGSCARCSPRAGSHRSFKRRDRRRREHRARLAEVAAAGGISLDTAQRDRSARARADDRRARAGSAGC